VSQYGSCYNIVVVVVAVAVVLHFGPETNGGPEASNGGRKPTNKQ